MFVPAALVAVSVALKGPAFVGVPVIAPLDATERPPGKPVPEKVIGVYPVAVMLLLNATPTVPVKAFVLVIVGGLANGAAVTLTVPLFVSTVPLYPLGEETVTVEYGPPARGPVKIV